MTTAEELQARVDAALRGDTESPHTFSQYRDSAEDLVDRFWAAAERGGVQAALDEFDRLRDREEIRRLQYALAQFIVHHPAAVEKKLRVPFVEPKWAKRDR